MIRKGSAVVGLSRRGNPWPSRPTGTVTLVHRTGTDERLTFRVQWNDSCVEDDMFADEIEAANVESDEEADYHLNNPGF